jgi:hypothetical protein
MCSGFRDGDFVSASSLGLLPRLSHDSMRFQREGPLQVAKHGFSPFCDFQSYHMHASRTSAYDLDAHECENCPISAGKCNKS